MTMARRSLRMTVRVDVDLVDDPALTMEHDAVAYFAEAMKGAAEEMVEMVSSTTYGAAFNVEGPAIVDKAEE